MTEVSKEESKKQPIQRLLRRMDSQDYFSDSGWTTDITAARSFEDSMAVVSTCTHLRLFDVEIVLRVAGGTADLFCTRVR